MPLVVENLPCRQAYATSQQRADENVGGPASASAVGLRRRCRSQDRPHFGGQDDPAPPGQRARPGRWGDHARGDGGAAGRGLPDDQGQPEAAAEPGPERSEEEEQASDL